LRVPKIESTATTGFYDDYVSGGRTQEVVYGERAEQRCYSEEKTLRDCLIRGGQSRKYKKQRRNDPELSVYLHRIQEVFLWRSTWESLA